MSIQGRSASDRRHTPACDRAGVDCCAPPRAAKSIASTLSSHSAGWRLPALAAALAFVLAGCSSGKTLIKAEPLPRARSGALRTADADALAAATAQAAMSHAARERAARVAMVSTKRAGATPPRGWVTARSTVWIPAVDAMGQHLALADTAIADRNAPRAQWQLDEAADRLGRDGGGHAAVRALRVMAGRVGQREWPTAHAFDLLLVQANSADSRHGWGSRMPYSAYVERPLRQIQRAEKSYASGRRLSAAGALRDAAIYIDRTASHAAAEAQAPLDASSAELRRVAARLETSTAPVTAALNGAALHATAALADEHALQARALWRAHDEAATGRELQAAALYLHETAAYGAPPFDQRAIDQARELSTRLLAHAPVPASTVDRRISDLEREIGKVRGTSARNSS